MTPLLAEALKRANPAQHQHIEECVRFYRGQFTFAQGHVIADESIAAGMHDATDRATKLLRKRDPRGAKRVACKRGCAHCCFVEVAVTRPEARLLLMAATDAGVSIDRERLLRQRDAADFRALPLADRRCVFLNGKNECDVYEHRPIACRKYQVVDTAEFCDTVKHPGHPVGNFVSIEAECLQTAALAGFDHGRMAQQLLEWLPDAA